MIHIMLRSILMILMSSWETPADSNGWQMYSEHDEVGGYKVQPYRQPDGMTSMQFNNVADIPLSCDACGSHSNNIHGHRKSPKADVTKLTMQILTLYPGCLTIWLQMDDISSINVTESLRVGPNCTLTLPGTQTTLSILCAIHRWPQELGKS